MTTLIATIDAAGISAPSYTEIYSELQAIFRGIYGTDAYLEPDSQDGQLLAVFAKALHDANQTAVQAYYSFSPASAIGEALSNNVRINGLQRKVPTRSQVTLDVVGQENSVITNGVVADANGVKWSLPAVVVIGASGHAVVNATAQEEGAIEALPNTINNIVTPAKGWQSVNNYVAAVPGAPVETDGALRRRQSLSTANSAQAITKSIAGSLASIPSVIKSRVYENDTNAVNSYGHPAHSITAVVLGGSPEEIASTIYYRKTPGAYTNGDVAVQIDDDGYPNIIRFYIANQVRVRVAIDIHPLSGFIATTLDQIKVRVAEYINSLGIGQKVDQGRLYLPAQFYGNDVIARTFEVNSIRLTSSASGSPVDADLTIAFNAIATCDVDDILINTI